MTFGGSCRPRPCYHLARALARAPGRSRSRSCTSRGRGRADGRHPRADRSVAARSRRGCAATARVEVTGQLVDKLTGDGLGGQTVTIQIGDDVATATTEPDGRFRAHDRACRPARSRSSSSSPAANLLEPARARRSTTDPSKAQVALHDRASRTRRRRASRSASTADDVERPAGRARRSQLASAQPATDADAQARRRRSTTGQPFILTAHGRRRRRAASASARRSPATTRARPRPPRPRSS